MGTPQLESDDALNEPGLVNGGAKRIRTADLLRAREALSQLSYRPALGLGQYTGAA